MPLPRFKLIRLSPKKLLLSVVTALILAAVLWAGYAVWQRHCKPAVPPDTVAVSLTANPLLSLQILIAENQGFFQEQNLDVALSLRQSNNLQDDLASGTADLYTCGLEELLFREFQAQAPGAQIIAQLTRQDPSFLLGRYPEEKFSWETCSGSSVITGSWEDGPALVLEAIGREHNLLPQRSLIFLQNLPAELKAAAFASGSGTYLQTCEPQASYLEASAIASRVLTMGTEAPEIAACILTAAPEYLREQGQTAQKFLNALQKACLWLQYQKPTDLLPIIQDWFPEYKKEVLLKGVEQYYKQGLWTRSIVINETAYYAYQSLIIASGELPQEIAAAKLVNNSLAQKAAQEVTWQPPDPNKDPKKQ